MDELAGTIAEGLDKLYELFETLPPQISELTTQYIGWYQMVHIMWLSIGIVLAIAAIVSTRVAFVSYDKYQQWKQAPSEPDSYDYHGNPKKDNEITAKRRAEYHRTKGWVNHDNIGHVAVAIAIAAAVFGVVLIIANLNGAVAPEYSIINGLIDKVG